MKKYSLFILITGLSIHSALAQTTVTVDANDVLNSNTKIVAYTSIGQSFFTGHQSGGGYAYPYGIFRAITDNPNGLQNFYFDGVTNGSTNFSVRADGQGYFAGSIGIGTTNPTGLLTLGTNATSNPNPNSSGADIPYSSLNFQNYAGGSYFNVGKIASIQENGAFVDAGALSFLTGAGSLAERMRIATNGNIGIGTKSPAYKLDIQGGNASIYNNGTITQFNVGGLIGKTQINLSTSADANGYGAIQSVSVGGSAFGNTNINPYGGNVGIGTTNPDAKLTVNGTVHSKEVKVDLNVPGPDYVFEKDYKLKTLAEVQKYIAVNKHLPEIPSAKVMEQNGVDLSEMNMQLLKKVEELTLYLIEKNKQVKEQQCAITEQQKQINQLSQHVKELAIKITNVRP